jgi:hypothetical protein
MAEYMCKNIVLEVRNGKCKTEGSSGYSKSGGTGALVAIF